MRPWDPINDHQLRVLRRIGAGEQLDVSAEHLALTLYALRDRALIEARRRKGEWHIVIADPGRFYLQHGYHPRRPEVTSAEQDDAGNADHRLHSPTSSRPFTELADSLPDGKPEPATFDVHWMAEQLGMSAGWVYAHRFEIPHHDFGRTLRFTRRDLEAYLRITAVPSTRMMTTGRSRHRY